MEVESCLGALQQRNKLGGKMWGKTLDITRRFILAINITPKAEEEVMWCYQCNKGVYTESCLPLKCWSSTLHLLSIGISGIFYCIFMDRLLTLQWLISCTLLALLNWRCKSQPPLHRQAEGKVFTVWFVRCLLFLNQVHTLQQPVQGGKRRICKFSAELCAALCLNKACQKS